MRTGSEMYGRKTDAERALTLIEADMMAGKWADPERGKVRFGDYAATWIAERPGLRVRTVDLYSWLLAKHIVPYLGGVQLGKLSTPMIRKWRADLLGSGVSVSMAAKAYRLLRAVLTTAVEEDKLLPRNPCRVRSAGEEHAPERPVLAVAQVFDLSERVGRRPVGNVRKRSGGGYRLRFGRNGNMRAAPGVYSKRSEAERALWDMADAGRADFNQDGRFRAMVLLATFASLRWGEVTALTRSDLDLTAGTVRVRAAFTQRRATQEAPFAAAGGAGIKDLMARVGHDSERAALIYQHRASGADKIITDSIDAHVEADRGRPGDDGGAASALVPVG